MTEFEDHFKNDVKLPFKMPSIPFTHMFGRFWEDKEYNINDSLEIEFINEKSPINHYKIDIRPLKNKVVSTNRSHQTVYTVNADLKFPNFAGIKIPFFAGYLGLETGKTPAFFFSLKR
ncbi:hypothetical protein K7T73_20040 (plasmid) [Bacillus badius]|uniref:hypothetical protein n=1 Tax=Bacillus badius TaxID=1455 RepID=UPI001CBCCC88|nr:hypothetical protein [Bacillus badius]UAT32937.1 hypothetical protein K7T73_20040 [Bacillus badius]